MFESLIVSQNTIFFVRINIRPTYSSMMLNIDVLQRTGNCPLTSRHIQEISAYRLLIETNALQNKPILQKTHITLRFVQFIQVRKLMNEFLAVRYLHFCSKMLTSWSHQSRNNTVWSCYYIRGWDGLRKKTLSKNLRKCQINNTWKSPKSKVRL